MSLDWACISIDNDDKAGEVFYQRVGRTLAFIDYLEQNFRTLYSREEFIVGELSEDKHTVHNGHLKQALHELRSARRDVSDCVFVHRVRPMELSQVGYDYEGMVCFLFVIECIFSSMSSHSIHEMLEQGLGRGNF